MIFSLPFQGAFCVLVNLFAQGVAIGLNLFALSGRNLVVFSAKTSFGKKRRKKIALLFARCLNELIVNLWVVYHLAYIKRD